MIVSTYIHRQNPFLRVPFLLLLLSLSACYYCRFLSVVHSRQFILGRYKSIQQKLKYDSQRDLHRFKYHRVVMHQPAAAAASATRAKLNIPHRNYIMFKNLNNKKEVYVYDAAAG